MAKSARKTSRTEQVPQAAETASGWSPLPPPRKSRMLLAVSIILVLAWIGFLLYLALGT